MSIIKEISDKWLETITQKYPELLKTVKATIEQFGGASSFIQTLKSEETQAKLKTWFQDGKHFVMSHEEVQKFLGNERIKAIADKLATTPEMISQQLSQVLPPLLEKLQQLQSAIPEGSFVQKSIHTVKNLMNRKST